MSNRQSTHESHDNDFASARETLSQAGPSPVERSASESGTDSRPPSRPTSTHFEEPPLSARPPRLSSIPEINRGPRHSPSEGELPVVLRHHQSIVTFLLSEKHINATIPKRKRRTKRNTESWNIISLPILIIFGQFAVLALAWSFFVILAFKGPLALPFSVASAARNNPQLLTLVVTLIATAISAISSFLLSLSIRYIVTYYLTQRSMTIFSLGTSIQIINRAFIFNHQHVWWTMMALFTLTITSLQTAAWSTLIAPVPIIVTNSLHGLELDITNNALMQSIFDTPASMDSRTIDSSNINSPTVQLSGLLAARAAVTKSISLLHYNQWIFNISTGGMLAAQIGPPSPTSYILLPGDRTSLRPIGSYGGPRGFASKYTVEDQQGFTADVVCQNQALGGTTSPSLTEQTAAMDTSMLGLGPATNVSKTRLYSWRWSTMCGDSVNWSDSYYTWTNDTVVGLACPIESSVSSATNYTLLIKGNGAFSRNIESVVCTISPRVTSLKVDYDQVINIQSSKAISSSTANANAVAAYAIAALQRRFSISQSLDTNEFAQAVLSVGQEASGSGKGSPGENLLKIIEAFLKGHIEFSVSLLRFYIVDAGLDRQQPINDNSTAFRSTSGIYRVETMGFEAQPGVLNIVLVPITCVCLASLILVFVVLVQKARDGGLAAQGLIPDDELEKKMAAAHGDVDAGAPGSNTTDGNIDQRASSAPTMAFSSFSAHVMPKSLKSQDVDLQSEAEGFDVGDPFHLLSVSTAGGLTGILTDGLSESELMASHNVPVRLGRVDRQNGGSGVGLVCVI